MYQIKKLLFLEDFEDSIKNHFLYMIGLTVKFVETYRIDQDFNQCYPLGLHVSM